MSLRERNRIDTWTAIHNAAAELALAHGWTQTTIEKISSQAGVSKRTFFNYFPSKEDAILGALEPSIPDAALEAFEHSDEDLAHRTVDLTLAVIRASYPYEEGRARRRKLMKTLPELGSRVKHLSVGVEQLVEPVVLKEMLRIAEESPKQFNQSAEDAARALTLYAHTILRFAFTKNPDAIPEQGTEAVASAITTFREVIQTSIWLT
ncbi:TetR/AcrR family transcriptional regulator [Gulosibacter chungangensis]|nr:TetR family transcriptional regulator [Gulosibacter chungangensis]